MNWLLKGEARELRTAYTGRVGSNCIEWVKPLRVDGGRRLLRPKPQLPVLPAACTPAKRQNVSSRGRIKVRASIDGEEPKERVPHWRLVRCRQLLQVLVGVLSARERDGKKGRF